MSATIDVTICREDTQTISAQYFPWAICLKDLSGVIALCISREMAEIALKALNRDYAPVGLSFELKRIDRLREVV